MKMYKVVIEGTKPLMHHAFKVLEKKRKRAFNPEEEAENCLYKDSRGRIYQPASHIEGALIKSSTDFRWSGRKTYKHIVSSEVTVIPEEIPFLIPENPEEYKIDIRSIVSPSTKGRQLIARPIWNHWRFKFYLKVDDETELDGDMLKKILINAGKRYGIGTYRLKFGRFKVIEFREVNSIEL